ncbi:MAG: hypothetical protein AAF715_10505 [Myxococcota bacterium]
MTARRPRAPEQGEGGDERDAGEASDGTVPKDITLRRRGPKAFRT